MTQFINAEKIATARKERQETTLLEEQTRDGWMNVNGKKIVSFEKVVYLGKCIYDGDMFACYSGGTIAVYKGIKGDEFND